MKPVQECVVYIKVFLWSIAVAAKDAQQIEEHVDEVQIEAQGTHQRNLLCRCLWIVRLHEHVLYALGVIDGQSGEDCHTNPTYHKVHEPVLDEEDVHQRSDDKSHHSH